MRRQRGEALVAPARELCKLLRRGLLAPLLQNLRNVRVVVHLECRYDVFHAADANGSTEFIAKAVAEAPPGSTLAVGTEIHLVQRLAAEHPDKTVFSLDPLICPCSTMFRIDAAHLAWVLENLVEDRVVNQITVDPDTTRWARVALERMLEIT